MVEVPVYNMQGEQIEMLRVDEARFGGEVNVALLKQAIVAYHCNQHQGSAKTKSRSEVAGSGRKLFRQKGTGNARSGPIRTPVRRGGGMAFAKTPHPVRQRLNRKMRHRALDSAILAKLLGDDLMVVAGMDIDAPRTKTVATMLEKLKIDRSCLMTLGDRDRNVWLSARNIPRLTVRIVSELNAFDVAMRRKMLLTRGAMQTLLEGGR